MKVYAPALLIFNVGDVNALANNSSASKTPGEQLRLKKGASVLTKCTDD